MGGNHMKQLKALKDNWDVTTGNVTKRVLGMFPIQLKETDPNSLGLAAWNLFDKLQQIRLTTPEEKEPITPKEKDMMGKLYLDICEKIISVQDKCKPEHVRNLLGIAKKSLEEITNLKVKIEGLDLAAKKSEVDNLIDIAPRARSNAEAIPPRKGL